MSRKIKLSVDELAVESFATGDVPEWKGTVHGNIGTRYCSANDVTCTEPTCGAEQTCDAAIYSCAPSCGACGTHNCGGDGDTLICGTGDQSGITTCETCLVDCP